MLDFRKLLRREKLVDRAARQPREAPAPRTPGHRHQLIQVAPGHVATTRPPHASNHAAGVKRAAEDLRLRVRKHQAKVGDLEVVAKVWFVGSESEQRLLYIHALKRSLELDAEKLPPELAEQTLDQAEDVLLVAERHLDVQLCELRLSVGPQVLVTKAARDLVVALHAGHHQQLLQHLRRLRQRIERTW